MFLAALLAAGPLAAAWQAGDAPDQALVLWRSPLSAAELAAEAARLGLPAGEPLERLRSALDLSAGAATLLDSPAIGLHHVRLYAQGAAAVDAAVTAYLASGLVASAEPNRPIHAAGCPLPLNATVYAGPLSVSWSATPIQAQWGLTATAWQQAVADYCSGAVTLSGVITVAVIDSGLDAHPEFPTGMVLPGKTYHNGVVSAGNDDANGHGTFVSGLIGAAPFGSGPPQGIYGAFYEPALLHLLPLKILDACGQGTMGDLAAALVEATAQGAKVVNMSLESSQGSDALQAAVNAAWAAGVVMVAAAGNEGGPAGDPAAYAPVMSVAALDHADAPTAYSNNGKVDLSAPGGDDTDPDCNTGNAPHDDFCLAPGFYSGNLVDSCRWEVFSLSSFYASNASCALQGYNANRGCPNVNGFAAASGTSFSAPLVSAAAALLFAQNPGRSPGDVVQRLEQSALPTAWGGGWNSHAGWGKLSFRQALDQSFTPVAPGTMTVWNYPNPFKPSRHGVTTFSADLPYSGSASLEIYDAAGQKVRSFSLSGPGMARVDWDGRNGLGSLVANGGYRGVLTQGGLRSVARVAVLQ